MDKDKVKVVAVLILQSPEHCPLGALSGSVMFNLSGFVIYCSVSSVLKCEVNFEGLKSPFQTLNMTPPL